jgi:three-Cys-motif partner protein
LPPRKDDEFWETAKDWSQRKHLIIKYYLQPAVAKLRAVSPDERVLILDGFAGRGQYEDGTPGSPVLTGRLADECQTWSKPVDLRIFNIEPNCENFRELQSHTDAWVQKGVIRNLKGSFQQQLPLVLQEAGRSPLFAFLDPFRPGDLSFSDFSSLLLRRAVTELCFVFHTPAVYRIVQAIRPEARTSEESRERTRATLDRILGSSRLESLLSRPSLDPDDVVDPFKEELRVRAAPPRAHVVSHALRARYAAGLKYHLVFFTRHPDGLRLMNDAFCKETQTAYRQSGFSEQLNLGLDIAMPPVEMPYARRLEELTQALTGIGRSDPARVWKRSELVLESISNRFGEFSESQHLQAVKHLLGQKSAPRLVVVGSGSTRTASSRTNEKTGSAHKCWG